MRVRVYRNLHKQTWSVVDIKSGRVQFHADRLGLSNCRMRVRESGRQRVLRERKKNVHAFIEGDITPIQTALIPVGYNPYQAATFVRKDSGEAVHEANHVVLTAEGRVFATWC